MDDFIPSDLLKRTFKFWWFLLLLMVLGGLAGMLAVKLQKPVYESQASITTSIDFAYSGRLNEDEEDFLISTVGDIISSSDVFKAVKEQASSRDISVTDEQIAARFSKARQGYRWEITVRDETPAMAQTLTQIWLEAADSALADFHARTLETVVYHSAEIALLNCFCQMLVLDPASAYCSPANISVIRELLASGPVSESLASQPNAILLSKISTEITANAYLPTNPEIFKRNLTTLVGAVGGLLIALGILIFGKGGKK